MREALADLDYTQQISKNGLLQNTTTCCATGTRTLVEMAKLDGPEVQPRQDSVSPYELRETLPPLVV